MDEFRIKAFIYPIKSSAEIPKGSSKHEPSSGTSSSMQSPPSNTVMAALNNSVSHNGSLPVSSPRVNHLIKPPALLATSLFTTASQLPITLPNLITASSSSSSSSSSSGLFPNTMASPWLYPYSTLLSSKKLPITFKNFTTNSSLFSHSSSSSFSPPSSSSSSSPSSSSSSVSSSSSSISSSPPSLSSSFSSSSSPLVTSTSPSSRQQPIAAPHIVPYHLVDVEVRLRSGCRDIMLQGKVAVVKSITGKIATVRIRNNSSDLTIPHESLVPVLPRRSDMVKVIGGKESVLGLIGTLVSEIGDDGVVQFMSYNKQRQRNPAQIPLSQLGRYTPLSKFSTGPSPAVGMFSQSSGLGLVRSAASTSAGNSQLLYPIQLVKVPSLGVPSTSLMSPSAFTFSSPMSVPAMPPPRLNTSKNHARPSLSFGCEDADTSSLSGATFSLPPAIQSPLNPSKDHIRMPTLFRRRVDADSSSSSISFSSPISVPAKLSRPPSLSKDPTIRPHLTLRNEDVDWETERDSVTLQSIFPRRKRHGSATSPPVISATNSITSKVWPDPSAKDLVQSNPTQNLRQFQRMDKPTGQLFTFPVKKFVPDPKLQFILNQAHLSGVVSRGGSNGYVLSEVLEKLVRNQRNCMHELTSPTTPGSSSHDIKTSCVCVSLVCPLSQQRMKYPSRGTFCKHLQCFDAENYIIFHEKQTIRKKIKQIGGHSARQHIKKWNCPICEKITQIHHLYIDKALMKLVKESDATEVELSRNGWVPVKKRQKYEVIDLTGD